MHSSSAQALADLPDASPALAALADESLSAEALLERAVEMFSGRLALVSSFGAEAAVLLDLMASVDPTVPVLFVDTGKLFGETQRYRDKVAERLGLTDVRSIRPRRDAVQAADPNGILWTQDPDACCALRKVEPLERALSGFDAWISGRKRFHGATRASLPKAEVVDGRVKINPLADWTREEIQARFEASKLPRHPLEADGFLSIGCMPCTDRVQPGEDIRAGRWRGQDKTECGIHFTGSGDGI
ncbi:Phosphoadenylyl-sulfate reductase [Caenispirillum salinarum AK4]|uniref:Adenosine 5'-phosphosulfate reductase n=1 Tax=Caenispirillum salinarum AK4 TaxID=1238182 RepID=K9H5H1_9PROT|nr:phosphoadenylyl-sulfate reductase [Caenispirillum salinarum]EKV32817.1 Phosphoadenylyl-sulfate reductase [Caenispirillum salinarum AK4]